MSDMSRRFALHRGQRVEYCISKQYRIRAMLIDDDSFGCLGIPTPLEMLKQQSVLLCDEVTDLNDRLRRSRSNVAELIEMNQQLAAERDALRVKLAATEARVSDCLRQAGLDCNQISGLKRIAEQVDMFRHELDQARKTLAEYEGGLSRGTA